MTFQTIFYITSGIVIASVFAMLAFYNIRNVMWEVFDPRHGRTLTSVRFRWQARLICRLVPTLDYDDVRI